LATRYDEIVVDRLFGHTQLTSALQPLVQATAQTLELDEDKRRRTVWRIDAGGGSVADVNWLLSTTIMSIARTIGPTRAQTLAGVSRMGGGSRIPSVKWAGCLCPHAYSRPVRRCRGALSEEKRQWGVGVLISTLSPHE